MQFPITFLLVVTCRVSTSSGIYNREDVGIRTNFETSDQFLNRVGDWYQHFKNRVYERLFGPTTTPSPTTTEVLNLNKYQLQKRLNNRERFLINLSTLSFDPDRDWGFRIGNWYFIRKEYEDPVEFNTNNPNEWDRKLPTTLTTHDQNTETTTETVRFSDETNRESTESSSILSTTDALTTHVTTQTMTQQTTMQSATEENTQFDFFEGFSTEIEKRMEDNEADSNFIHKGSVEVLMG